MKVILSFLALLSATHISYAQSIKPLDTVQAYELRSCAYRVAMVQMAMQSKPDAARKVIQSACDTELRAYSSIADPQKPTEMCGSSPCLSLEDGPEPDIRYGLIIIDKEVLPSYRTAYDMLRP